jgi:hypothetical protein
MDAVILAGRAGCLVRTVALAERCDEKMIPATQTADS